MVAAGGAVSRVLAGGAVFLAMGAAALAVFGVAPPALAGGDVTGEGGAPSAVDGMLTPRITFDLTLVDDTGLTGPPDGRVAVAYEFCIPATAAHLAEVQRIDPTVQAQTGARGRIGCNPGSEVLCIGSSHQPEWRSVLQQLAALDYVARIDRHFAE